mgnify:CR=1 FL=1
MDKDFLLSTPTAQHLFHDYAAKMPILDYHCHINPKEIAEDRKFENITQVWLGGDHYKWRQMRTNGVDEKYITGDASDREKFQKWAETLTRKLTIERLRVYVQAENLVTWTKYWGFDPEISSGATSLGVDRGIYPQARTYTVGVNVSF